MATNDICVPFSVWLYQVGGLKNPLTDQFVGDDVRTYIVRMYSKLISLACEAKYMGMELDRACAVCPMKNKDYVASRLELRTVFLGLVFSKHVHRGFKQLWI